MPMPLGLPGMPPLPPPMQTPGMPPLPPLNNNVDDSQPKSKRTSTLYNYFILKM